MSYAPSSGYVIDDNSSFKPARFERSDMKLVAAL